MEVRTRTRRCAACEASFTYPVSRGTDRKYCTARCRVAVQMSLSKTRKERSTLKCSNGLCNGRVVHRLSAELCEACYCYKRRTGTTRPINKPKGHYTAAGYKVVRSDGHPLARKGGWLFEHRKVAYLKHDGVCPNCHWCGFPLTWELAVVDHLNENKCDNRPENVVVTCDNCNLVRGSLLRFIRSVLPERFDQLVALMREQNAGDLDLKLKVRHA